MTIHTLPVGQLKTNCYIAVCDETQKAVVIDPGDEGEFISQKIQHLNVDLKYILLTHGHFDHVLGVAPLKLIYNVPLLMHIKDMFLLHNAVKSAEYWLKSTSDLINPPDPDSFVHDGSTISFGKTALKSIHTPGHTPGSVCYLYQNEKVLFSGDLVFKNGVGRTDFSYSSYKDLAKSINNIMTLPKGTTIYPGHGERTNLTSKANL